MMDLLNAIGVGLVFAGVAIIPILILQIGHNRLIKAIRKAIAEKAEVDGVFTFTLMQTRSMLDGDEPDYLGLEMATMQIDKVLPSLTKSQRLAITSTLESDSIGARWAFVKAVFKE